MKVLVLGWMRLAGTGKESNRPYDFARLHVANAVTDRDTGKMRVTGAGFEQAHIDMQLGAEGQFSGLKFPLVLELKIDHQLGRNGRMEAVCTGYVPAAAAVRQAG